MKYSPKEMKEFSNQLNSNLPKAERWFWNLWIADKMCAKTDEANQPFGYYIPDLINKQWKYVIEIDEAHHVDPTQQAKDQKRDNWFLRKGYFVFRVPAYDVEAYQRVVVAVRKLRNNHRPANLKFRVKKLSYFQKLKNQRISDYKKENPKKKSPLGEKVTCPKCLTKFYTLNKNKTCPKGC